MRAKFTGRWAAKEAVLKAISNSSPDSRHLWKGSAAPLKCIEISYYCPANNNNY